MTMKSMIATALVLAAACTQAFAHDGVMKRNHDRAQFSGVFASVDGGLAGFPTDYLTNRFGDRQLQGR